MSDLYHKLAPVYEAMYQTFMDYPGEYRFYAHNRLIVHEARTDVGNYRWESRWRVNLNHGFCFDWDATFYELSGGNRRHLGGDHSTIRTFTEEELIILLQLPKP